MAAKALGDDSRGSEEANIGVNDRGISGGPASIGRSIKTKNAKNDDQLKGARKCLIMHVLGETNTVILKFTFTAKSQAMSIPGLYAPTCSIQIELSRILNIPKFLVDKKSNKIFPFIFFCNTNIRCPGKDEVNPLFI